MPLPDWKKLEHLAAEIQRQLSPNSKISHNVKVLGRQSGSDRQVDVLIEDQVGQFPVRIAIECKDHNTPVDVNVVGAFQALLQDTKISKGVLVAPGGFTKAALQLAASHEIETYRPVDTDPHKWHCAVSIPTVCDFRSARVAIKLSFSLPLPMMIPYDSASLLLHDESNQPIGSVADVVTQRWDSGKYPIEPGLHKVPLCGESVVKIDNGYGQIVPVNLTALVEVTGRRFFGHTPVSKLRGFGDFQTGKVITNAFEFNLLDPSDVEEKWAEIGESDPPTPAALSLLGLYCLAVSGP